eukprot:m.86410 g.86410  ORF g.86410 m.86410 type:complete len:857 (-) comp8759_c0_seq1:97-2667(-)
MGIEQSKQRPQGDEKRDPSLKCDEDGDNTDPVVIAKDLGPALARFLVGRSDEGELISIIEYTVTTENESVVKNVLHHFRTLRHPSLLKMEWIQGKGKNVKAVVTEPVVTLSSVLSFLSQHEIISGLNDVATALAFLNGQQNNLCHGNVSMDSVFVSKVTGKWKLAGFELCKTKSSQKDIDGDVTLFMQFIDVIAKQKHELQKPSWPIQLLSMPDVLALPWFRDNILIQLIQNLESFIYTPSQMHTKNAIASLFLPLLSLPPLCALRRVVFGILTQRPWLDLYPLTSGHIAVLLKKAALLLDVDAIPKGEEQMMKRVIHVHCERLLVHHRSRGGRIMSMHILSYLARFCGNEPSFIVNHADNIAEGLDDSDVDVVATTLRAMAACVERVGVNFMKRKKHTTIFFPPLQPRLTENVHLVSNSVVASKSVSSINRDVPIMIDVDSNSVAMVDDSSEEFSQNIADDIRSNDTHERSLLDGMKSNTTTQDEKMKRDVEREERRARARERREAAKARREEKKEKGEFIARKEEAKEPQPMDASSDHETATVVKAISERSSQAFVEVNSDDVDGSNNDGNNSETWEDDGWGKVNDEEVEQAWEVNKEMGMMETEQNTAQHTITTDRRVDDDELNRQTNNQQNAYIVATRSNLDGWDDNNWGEDDSEDDSNVTISTTISSKQPAHDLPMEKTTLHSSSPPHKTGTQPSQQEKKKRGLVLSKKSIKKEDIARADDGINKTAAHEASPTHISKPSEPTGHHNLSIVSHSERERKRIEEEEEKRRLEEKAIDDIFASWGEDNRSTKNSSTGESNIGSSIKTTMTSNFPFNQPPSHRFDVVATHSTGKGEDDDSWGEENTDNDDDDPF